MNERAVQQIESLIAEGIEITPQDIVELNDLAEACFEKDIDKVSAPRVAWAGDVPIFQNTIQSDKWFSDFALTWWKGNSLFAALAWAGANARTRGFFEPWTNERQTRKEIERWANGLACTEQELVIAVCYATGTSTREPDTDDERAVIDDCPHTRIIHDCIAAGLGISVAELVCLPHRDCVDILTRWARNQIAINGGDAPSKSALISSANFKFLAKLEKLRAAKWQKTASIYA